MGLLQAFQKWRNPTADWVEDAHVPLEIDLDTGRFCGSTIGDSFEKLAFLGRGNPSGDYLEFVDKGVSVAVDNGLVGELLFYFGHPDEPDGGSFSGRFANRKQQFQ